MLYYWRFNCIFIPGFVVIVKSGDTFLVCPYIFQWMIVISVLLFLRLDIIVDNYVFFRYGGNILPFMTGVISSKVPSDGSSENDDIYASIFFAASLKRIRSLLLGISVHLSQVRAINEIIVFVYHTVVTEVNANLHAFVDVANGQNRLAGRS
ncbi:hypothetical protein ACK6VM_13490 [Citrobacter meridianamericanus]